MSIYLFVFLRLEPLLKRIHEDKRNVAIPIIDVIDDRTLEYQHNEGSHAFQVGGFNWNGHYTWVDVPIQEQRRINFSPTAPTR